MKKIGKNAKLYLIGMIIGGITLGLTTVVADTIINSTNVSYKTSTVKAALDDLYGLTADDIWKKIYPVGSIYISVDSTSPATLFGGTWEEFGQGRTLIGSGKVELNSTNYWGEVDGTEWSAGAGEMGGEFYHVLTVSEMPSHTHTRGSMEITGTLEVRPWSNGTYPLAYSGGAFYGSKSTTNRGAVATSAEVKSDYVNFAASRTWTGETSSMGGGKKHNNLPPYISVNMWKRTA